MARIAICWELGGGLAHVVRLVALADRLAARGHAPVFVARDPASVLRRLGGPRHRVLAAPAVPIAQRTRLDVSWADVLWNDCGFHDAAALEAGWCTWHELLARVDPALVVADGAPLALGAAPAGVPRVEATNAFFQPPPQPWPSFRAWDPKAVPPPHDRERTMLGRANAARALVGEAPLDSLDAMFAVDRRIVFGLPELDPYGPRDVDYVGPVADASHAEPPRWPAGEGPRLFVYAKRDYEHRERLLGALARMAGVRVAYYADGDAPSLPGHVAVHAHPVDTTLALADADAVACHAGSALVAESLLAGKPLLTLPMQAEQHNTGLRVVALGAGLNVTPPFDRPDFLGPLKRVVGEPAFRAAAQALADRHRALDPSRTVDRVASICEELVGSRRTAAA